MLKKCSHAFAKLLLTAALLFGCLPAAARASDTGGGFTTLSARGEAVRIFRDEFGVPHIFAHQPRPL